MWNFELNKSDYKHIIYHILRFFNTGDDFTPVRDGEGILGFLVFLARGHTNASFTLDTYTHVTPDMQKAASGIVGGFTEDLLGKGLRPWKRNGKAEPAP
mgnify:FL=1